MLWKKNSFLLAPFIFFGISFEIGVLPMRIIFTFLLLIFSLLIVAQDQEQRDKLDLLQERCMVDPMASLAVLSDVGNISVNNDGSLKWERKLRIKFFYEKKIDKSIADIIYYASNNFNDYAVFKASILELDAEKNILLKDVTFKFKNPLEIENLKIKRFACLDISYTINLPYDGKIPQWRFQAVYPTELSSLKVEIPSIMKVQIQLVSNFESEIQTTTEKTKNIPLNNVLNTVKIQEYFYQFSQLPAYKEEPFADISPDRFARLDMSILSVKIDKKEFSKLPQKRVEKVEDFLLSNLNFTGRLRAELEIRKDYLQRLNTIVDAETKIARIYDLVRRHMSWNLIDTLDAPRSLAKAWDDKKANSTEINLILVKLLMQSNFEAHPMIVCTRNHGVVDTNNFSIQDFNRTVACVAFEGRNIVLDATARFADYPLLSSSILNTNGLLISMDPIRWIPIKDTVGVYRNDVILLGHLRGDTSFLTNGYVNSTGYSKAERVEKLDRDSLKGLRNDWFVRSDKKMQLKHFIVANEYVDSLPLAQEFDIQIPLEKSDNLFAVQPTKFTIPDTLLSITETRKANINFGYRQHYTLVSEFSFPDNYDVYLMPNNVDMSIENGAISYTREFHRTNHNFYQRINFSIDKTYFSGANIETVAKFFKRIATLSKQTVLLKKLY